MDAFNATTQSGIQELTCRHVLTANAEMLRNAYGTLELNNLLSMFVIKHNEAFILPFLSTRLKFCLLRRVLFRIFHVVHVNLPTLFQFPFWSVV